MDDLAPDRTKPALVIGGAAALLPFVIHASSSSVTTVNGVVTEASYRDNVALACGVVAIVTGVIAAALARRPGMRPQLVGALVIIALGVWQILRGIGRA